jgi:hypothetical protein
MNLYLDHQIDISGVIGSLKDSERIEWVRQLAQSCDTEGTITVIREIVNNTNLDD